MNRELILEGVKRTARGLTMRSVWQHLGVEMSEAQIKEESQYDLFFYIMQRLLEDGDIKLAHGGAYLEGSLASQLESLKEAWPADPGEDDIDGIGLWFLAYAPAGIVWQNQDGTETWT
jgi:hypothetical protein